MVSTDLDSLSTRASGRAPGSTTETGAVRLARTLRVILPGATLIAITVTALAFRAWLAFPAIHDIASGG